MSQLKKLIIYVEGKDDLSFFAEFIEANFPSSGIVKQNNTSYSFVKDKFEKDSQLLEYGGDKFIFEISKIQDWLRDGYEIIVLADCDKSKADKEAHYNKIKQEYKIDFKLYLIGDDNDKGAIERIMQQCVDKEFIPLSECFKAFNACLKSSNEASKYLLPYPYSNIKAYFSNFKAIKINNAQNPKIFNFKHPSLDTLKVFLKPYFE